MYYNRYSVQFVLVILIITCAISVIIPFFRGTFNRNRSSDKQGDPTRIMQSYRLRSKQTQHYENFKYQQQRRRLQRQLFQRPVNHCFQVWKESKIILPETDMNNICCKENWSLLQCYKKQRNNSCSLLFMFHGSVNSWSYDPHHQLSNLNFFYSKQTLLQKSRLFKNENFCFKRWMTLLHSRLGNTRLGDLIIPGTHNSGSFSVSPNGTLIEKFWVFRLALFLGFHDYFTSWARNHDGTILAQLNAGYRCLDLRITVLPNGKFYWWHGISGEAIDPGLKDIANFVRQNPGEIIILLISHLNAPGNGTMEKLPMPYHSKLELGRHLLSVLGSTLVPAFNISLNPTLSDVLATGRNVIAIIREDLDLVKAFPEYFWSDLNNQTTVEFFERKTNPLGMFHHRSDIMQKYKQKFPNHLAITPAFVTHNTPNILGGILRSSFITWILSFVFIFIFYILVTSWLLRRFTYSVLFCRLEFSNIISVKCWWRATKTPVKFVLVSIVYVAVISLSVLLAHLQQRIILHFFGFEGKATNLLEMARIANLCGEDTSQPVGDIMYQSINSMIRHWSDREQEYRLNIVLVDDFSSSQVVKIAIQNNIRRTNRTVTSRNKRQQQQQQRRRRRQQRRQHMVQSKDSFNKNTQNIKSFNYKLRRWRNLQLRLRFVVCVLWHINPSRLLNDKSCSYLSLYIYIFVSELFVGNIFKRAWIQFNSYCYLTLIILYSIDHLFAHEWF